MRDLEGLRQLSLAALAPHGLFGSESNELIESILVPNHLRVLGGSLFLR
jgi:hypothetical protein